MKEKLILELKELANEILLLEDGVALAHLRIKIQDIYEKLAVLDFLEQQPQELTNDDDTSQIIHEENTSNEVENELRSSFELNEEGGSVSAIIENEESAESDLSEDEVILENKETAEPDLSEDEVILENDEILESIKTENEEQIPLVAEDLFVPTFDSIKDDFSQKEEFKDTISLDETEKMFETKKESPKQLSLNDRLVKNSVQVGLNDRIAFVNNLFNFSQLEFNKVLSVLNKFDNESDAKKYIQHTLKVKYNWDGKEEIEERFMQLVERRFL